MPLAASAPPPRPSTVTPVTKLRSSTAPRLTPQVRSKLSWRESTRGQNPITRFFSLYAREYRKSDAYPYGLETTFSSDVRRFATFTSPFSLFFAAAFLQQGMAAGACLGLFGVACLALMPARVAVKSLSTRNSVRLTASGVSLVADFDLVVASAVDLASRTYGLSQQGTADLVATLLAERVRVIAALEHARTDLEEGSLDPALAAPVVAQVKSVTANARRAVAVLSAAAADQGEFNGNHLTLAADLLSTSSEAVASAVTSAQEIRTVLAEARERVPAPPLH